MKSMHNNNEKHMKLSSSLCIEDKKVETQNISQEGTLVDVITMSIKKGPFREKIGVCNAGMHLQTRGGEY